MLARILDNTAAAVIIALLSGVATYLALPEPAKIDDGDLLGALALPTLAAAIVWFVLAILGKRRRQT